MKPQHVNFPHDVVGIPRHFDPDHYLDSVEQMICADEIVNALKMLDMFPGYYRDNMPPRALEIKKRVYQQLMNTTEYATDSSESQAESEAWHKTPLADQWQKPHFNPRGPIMVDLVTKINDQGLIAEIHELGPANGWLPAALTKLGLKFHHYGYGIDGVKYSGYIGNLSKKQTIFCCFEVIEHLWNPDDIYHYYSKAVESADHILIGCPKYTLFGGLSNWDSRMLGHIRTYTPSELYQFCAKHWPGYSWQLNDSNMMVVQGRKNEI